MQTPERTRPVHDPLDGPPPIKRVFRSGLSHNELGMAVRTLLGEFIASEDSNASSSDSSFDTTAKKYQIIK